MSRRLRTTLRNEAEGVTWSASPDGARGRIEIAFDDDPELWAEALDGWIMGTGLAWRAVAAAPPAVRAWLALDALAAQCSHNGLAMYFMDCEEGLVAHTAEAARAPGLEALAAQFEAVAEGAAKAPGRVKLGSPKAAQALERFASTELPPLLMAWVRRHAESFVPVPPEAPAG